MSDYGDNFEFRVPPDASARGGRYAAPGTAIPIGAPVVVDTSVAVSPLGLSVVKLAPQGTEAREGASKGIAVYEYGPAAFAGDDPFLTTYSQKSLVPAGAAVQVIRGDPTTKVVFRNTVAHKMLGVGPQRTGRIMVAGLGATPAVAVGDFLVPGPGDDVNGYWQAGTDESTGWLVITLVDPVRAEVEARMLF